MNLSLLAYLDPGSGALVLQLVLAALLTAGVYFRRILLMPFSIFRKSQRTPPEDEPPRDQ